MSLSHFGILFASVDIVKPRRRKCNCLKEALDNYKHAWAAWRHPLISTFSKSRWIPNGSGPGSRLDPGADAVCFLEGNYTLNFFRPSAFRCHLTRILAMCLFATLCPIFKPTQIELHWKYGCCCHSIGIARATESESSCRFTAHHFWSPGKSQIWHDTTRRTQIKVCSLNFEIPKVSSLIKSPLVYLP